MATYKVTPSHEDTNNTTTKHQIVYVNGETHNQTTKHTPMYQQEETTHPITKHQLIS